MSEPTRDALLVIEKLLRVSSAPRVGSFSFTVTVEAHTPTDEELEPIHLAWLREKVGVDLGELREALDTVIDVVSGNPEQNDALRVRTDAARRLLDLLGEEDR